MKNKFKNKFRCMDCNKIKKDPLIYVPMEFWCSGELMDSGVCYACYSKRDMETLRLLQRVMNHQNNLEKELEALREE